MIGDYIDIDAPYSFIGGGVMEPEIIDGLWDFWNDPAMETLFEKTPGHCGGMGEQINKEVKDSIDMTIPRYIKDKRICSYIDGLAEITREYVNYWPMLRTIHWDLQSDFNIQWYPKGGGFKQMHCERNNADIESVTRVMAWMTYLNDVEEGGETLFDIQQSKVKPKKGLTLIWPADWTYTHKGRVSMEHDKLIATGWYSFA